MNNKHQGEIDVSELKAKQPLSECDQIIHLRKQILTLTGEQKNLREQLGAQKELAESVAAAVVAECPLPRFKYTQSQKKHHPIVPVLKLSDLHIGEVVEANEVEGFNAFNFAIAQARIYGIVDDFLKWVAINRTFYHIDTCHVFCEGDFISGDIHYELQVTNEFPLPVQTAKAGLLLGEVLRILASHFKHLIVSFVGADNHARLQKKPQAKQKCQNSMSFLVQTIAAAKTERCANIKFIVSDGMKLLVDVNGKKVLSEHGDTIKGWAGLPFYGFNRMIGKEAKRRMNTDKGFHYWSIAHFHVPGWFEDTTLLNGSLSGTSEFDHSQGRHALPSQVAYLMHPTHGVFNFTPFHG